MTRGLRRLGWCWVAGILSATGQELFVRDAEKVVLQSPRVNEGSGLAVSTQDGRFLWIVNDSGCPAVLHLTDINGADCGSVSVEGAENLDWEDMAAFRMNGISYLLIADTGDNLAARDFVTLYVVKEPVLPKGGEMLNGSVKPVWKIHFRFEDGPRDCEAVAVDVKAGKVILISKRTKPPQVYELSLRPQNDAEFQIAKKVGQTSVNPPAGTLPLPFIKQPTGLAISHDGSQAAIVTYYGIFVFARNANDSWGDVFDKPAVTLKPHGLEQAESLSFSGDGKSIYAISEGAKSPLIRYSR